MKLRFAIVGLVALGGAALTTEMASAMPLAPLEQSQASNVENVALVAARVVVSVLPPSIVGTATVSLVTDMACVEVMPCVEVMLTTAAIAATNIKKGASAPFSLWGRRARHPIRIHPQ